jgi:Holliday junction resolvasome RuvABC endonuclease subunit
METFNIIGIDPSSSNVGISIMAIDISLNIEKINTILLNLDNLPQYNNGIDKLTNRLYILRHKITEVMRQYTPFMVGIENSFINLRRPGAMGPLSQSIFAIESGILDYNSYISFNKYPPSIIKKEVGAKFSAGKDEVLNACNMIPSISNLINLNMVSEHEVDATAIAYTLLSDIKQNKDWLCMRSYLASSKD